MRGTDEVSSAPPPEDPAREGIPRPVALLRWVYFGRLSVAIAISVAAVVNAAALAGYPSVSGGAIATVVIAAVATLLFTTWSSWHSHVRRAPIGRTFLYAQLLFDLALVTTVVHLTGGVNSDFASLYILVIAVSAVAMPFGSTILITFAAASLYFTDSVWGATFNLSPAVWLQIGVFVAVALATGWLASRVRVVGAQREELEQEVERIRLEASDILREISGGIVTVHGDGTLLFANRAAERLLGFATEDYRSEPFLDFLSSRSQELWAAIFATQRDGRRQIRAEGTIKLAGRVFPVGVTTTAHQPMAGEEMPSVTAIFTDISDQQRLNELHVRNERLEAVATLSAALAHEIKNPLASIRSSVEQLGRSARVDDDDRSLADLVVRESDRLSRLLSEFLDFSRVRMTAAQRVELSAAAAGAVALVRSHPDCADSAVVEVTGEEVSLQGDEDLVHRIVFNLALNAVQIIGPSARVRVDVADVHPTVLPVGVPSEMHIRLCVSDNGPGIPEELKAHLFDPFVTGREGGSGLGLAIVQRAVEAHHGMIFVDSDPQSGTTFSIYFPSNGIVEEVGA